MGGFAFTVEARDGRARAGELTTPHGTVATPVFMPVGTAGAVKAVVHRDLREIGVQILLANTYHLMLRPGDALVAGLGGLHGFTGWQGPFLTDSGGYQVFSLAALRRLDEAGVRFQSHLDGTAYLLSPERSIAIQQNLGADIKAAALPGSWRATLYLGRHRLATGDVPAALYLFRAVLAQAAQSRDALLTAIRSITAEAAAAGAAPDGVIVSRLNASLRELDVFRQGWFQVQDEAAQLVTVLLGPQPGETVLDACAGRGGKTGHIAQLMKNQGRLVALDQSIARLSQLRDEMARLGVSMVSVCETDLMQPDACRDTGPFDRILLDAPCSGLGTLRRNPDIKWSADKKNLQRHRGIQTRLLQRVSAWLKPTGTMVYAVCSPEPEETVEVVEAFIASNPRFRVHRKTEDLPDAIRPMIDSSGFLQTYPHLSYMDGFFAVRLKFRA